MKQLNKAVLAVCIQSALMSNVAFAQEDNANEQPSGLETITVTAQKRSQTIAEVPAQVSAITGEAVKDYMGAAENIRALAGRVPSLQIESSNGRQSPRFYIRGLGNTDFDVNANQPVSMVLDEVSLENAVLKSIPIFDLERVEVLNGPQGTLFGRNTPAGIVKIDTAKPEFDDYGYVSGGFGKRDTWFVESAYNTELSENFAARVSLKYQERDAWIDNIARNEEVGGFEELAYRLQLLGDFDDTRVLLKLHGFDQDGDMPQVFYGNALESEKEGLPDGFNPAIISHNSASGFELDHIGGSLKVEHDFGMFDFTSITGYDELESFSFADIDGSPIQILATGDGLSDHYQINQEFRISKSLDNVFFQVGLYFFDEDITVDSNVFDGTDATVAFTQTDQRTISRAVFGQVEVEASDDLAITAGLRYTEDDKQLDIREGGTNNILHEINKDDNYVNWDLSARYTIDDNFTTFARVATSSRGPVTIGRFGFPSSAETETLTSYEVGLKSELLDRSVRWNITAYTYDIEDHQLTATGGEANTNSLLNADNTSGHGIETDIEAIITDELRVSANLSYNHTEIEDDTLGAELCGSTPKCKRLDPPLNPDQVDPVKIVSVDGNPLPRAPEWLGNVNISYEIPFNDGYMYAQTDWNYRSDSNIFLYEAVEFVAEARWIGGVRAGYKNDDGFDVAIVGRNITDEIVVDGALDFLNLTAFVNEPRYWGIEARYAF
ncbi:TonB-dependent receptor [Aestuariibacter sp. AA17]|uniref:TonB-dependent receptor n=1 Tax=Fluctibacter corallii TaxID=2984329 RepID=A0ABT3A5J0_9ALTE|nr:TonB-dependent receptor [Aestuariibacter sp. AA17]MCV2883947.1 TonB-dependent receptor [Aestuariibacter sp. AA17]